MSDQSKPLITLEINLCESMTPEEFWPDGVPEKVTLDEVLRVIEECGGPREMLREWDLLNNIDMNVILHHPTESGQIPRVERATVDSYGDEIEELRIPRKITDIAKP